MPAPSFMAQHGATMVDNDYAIIPIFPRAKVPARYIDGEWRFFAGWQKQPIRKTCHFLVSGPWSSWPECGVGIKTGWTIGVDLDILDPEWAIKAREFAFEALGRTPLIRIGRNPKALLVYRTESPFRKITNAPVEILGEGQQFVAFGIHPDTGQPYRWIEESPADINWSSLPVITAAQALDFANQLVRMLPQELRPQIRRHGGPSSGNRESSPSFRGTYEGVAEALQHIPNGDTHYDDWIRIGHAIKAAVGEVGKELWLDWSAMSDKNQPEVTSQKWATFRPTAIGAGTLYYEAMQFGWRVPPDMILNGDEAGRFVVHDIRQIAANIYASLPAPPDPDGPASVDLSTIPAHLWQQPAIVQQVASPAFVVEAPGLIGDITRWMLSAALYPQPMLALAAAISAVGTAGGRRYVGPHGVRPNTFFIAIAESGAGKEHQINCLNRLFTEARAFDFLAGEDIASSAAVHSSLASRAVQLFMIDEIGHFMAGILSERGAPHKRDVMTLLTKLATSAGRTVRGVEYADKRARPRVDIVEPFVAVYGMTVPEPLFRALGSGSMQDGSVARWLFFVSNENHPDRNRDPADIAALSVNDPIVQSLSRIVGPDEETAIGPQAGTREGGYMTMRQLALSPAHLPKPQILVVMTADAHQLRESYFDESTAMKRYHERGEFAAVYARWLEHVMRLATVAAMACDPFRPMITVEHLRWARSVVDHCILSLVDGVRCHLADSTHEQNLKRVLDIIRKAGGPIRQRLLSRKTQFLNLLQRDQILFQLGEGGQIRSWKEAAEGGQEIIWYEAIDSVD